MIRGKNKYNNKKVTIDGHKFDSVKEGRRYLALKSLLSSGIISNLQLQPEFVLQDKFKYDGKIIRAIRYRADFIYFKNGYVIVEDVKGMKTDIYKIKRKLFLKRYPDLVFIET